MRRAGAEVAKAVLDRLPRSEAAFIQHVQTDTRPSPDDYAKAEHFAQQAAGQESVAFVRFCDARARRLVIASLPLLVALIPVTLANPIMTGDDLEQAIAAVDVGEHE